MREMQMLLLLYLTGAALFLDLKYQRIPNGLILTGLFCGLFYQIVFFRWTGLAAYVSGIFLPVILLGILYYFRMIGAGDIKLLCIIGGFLGPGACLRCMIYSFLFGGMISAVLMVKRRNLYSRLFYFKNYISLYLETKQWSPYMRTEDKDSHIHFSVPVFISILCYLGGVY